MKAFVTGGAGFIGSHLVDALLSRGHEVTVYDLLSTGSLRFLEGPLGLEGGRPDPRLHVVEGDILDQERLTRSMAGHDQVFHLAANADVRGGPKKRWTDLEQNTVGTQRVLEATRVNGIRNLLFTSSAVVYGEPEVFPTPEGYRGRQTSLYGASKLAAESLVEAYAHYDEMRAQVFRFVSLVGERYTHGVVFDFVKKLRADPNVLEVLGDGHQKKSYLYVGDAVAGMLRALEAASDAPKGAVSAYNLGHEGAIEAREVADIVCDELALKGTTYRFTGGRRGWPGDSPRVELDTARIRALGWKPTISIEEGIRRTVRYLVSHPDLLERGPARGHAPTGTGPTPKAPSGPSTSASAPRGAASSA